MSRNLVENYFTAFKSPVLVGKLYFWDTMAIFGHVFVGFLYLYCWYFNWIKQAGLSAHLSPQELLLKLSKVYSVVYGEEKWMAEVPKQVREIAEILNLDI
jgi:hypothetical protein